MASTLILDGQGGLASDSEPARQLLTSYYGSAGLLHRHIPLNVTMLSAIDSEYLQIANSPLATPDILIGGFQANIYACICCAFNHSLQVISIYNES